MIAPRDDFPSELERQVTLAFGPGGLLSKSSQFEYRPQQQSMATAVAKGLPRPHAPHRGGRDRRR